MRNIVMAQTISGTPKCTRMLQVGLWFLYPSILSCARRKTVVPVNLRIRKAGFTMGSKGPVVNGVSSHWLLVLVLQLFLVVRIMS